MRVNVKKFLEQAGVKEPFYPGKRLVHKMRQTGEYKSHCVVFDWRNPDQIRIEIKAGLSGRDLEPDALKYYPVSFQSPTYVNIDVVNDNALALIQGGVVDDEDEEGAQGSSGKGGGGKSPAAKAAAKVKKAKAKLNFKKRALSKAAAAGEDTSKLQAEIAELEDLIAK